MTLAAETGVSLLGSAATFLVCALLSAPLSTLVHELGHALAGRLVGLKAVRVVVGSGPVAWRVRLAGLPLEIGRGLLLGGGATHHERPARPSRARTAVMLLGGPAANLALAAVAAGVAARTPHPGLAAAGLGLIASQFAFAVDALWPRPARLGERALASDGQALLALFARK